LREVLVGPDHPSERFSDEHPETMIAEEEVDRVSLLCVLLLTLAKMHDAIGLWNQKKANIDEI
jgi:hypothetical protein